jgi:hypothetical protein
MRLCFSGSNFLISVNKLYAEILFSRLNYQVDRGGARKKLKGRQIKNIILKRLILSYFIQGRGWEKFPCRDPSPPSQPLQVEMFFFIWY